MERQTKNATPNSSNTFFEPEDRQQLAAQEINFLVHELINVLGPSLRKK